MTPYVTIYFSARIINELAGLRRMEELKTWVIWTLAVEAVLGLVRYGAVRWADAVARTAAVQEDITPYMKKLFSMDYANIDNQETIEKLRKIRMNESYIGLGFPTLRMTVQAATSAVTGMISALALTASLFSLPVPGESPLSFLNSPLFLVGILALLLGVTVLSGYLSGAEMRLRSKTNEEGV